MQNHIQICVSKQTIFVLLPERDTLLKNCIDSIGTSKKSIFL